MVLNYIKEQIVLGQIEARKIFGKLNTADMHTKPLCSSSEFLTMAHRILSQPPPLNQSVSTLSTSSPLPAETVSGIMDTDAKSQPGNDAKRSLPADSAPTINAKRRKAHILRLSLVLARIRRWMRTYLLPQSDCIAVSFLLEA
jgi:hypothetical protein